eukprot:11409975-Karenia_brevis.AAC.1
MLQFGSKRVEQSVLFRKAIGMMHLHHPRAERDHVHQVTYTLVSSRGFSMFKRIWAANFVLEFAFLSRWLDLKGMKKAFGISWEGSGRAFAKF